MALTRVIMPKTGAEMVEGRILAWKKKVGERVAKGETLLEIETDKATMEVEAPGAGVLLRCLFREGETAAATRLIALLGDGNESPEEIEGIMGADPEPESRPAPVSPEPAAYAPTPAAADEKRAHASPVARRLALEKGINLASIQGTGPGGRIEKDDVLLAAARMVVTPKSAESIPLSPMRRAVGRRVQQSKREIPDFSVSMVMDMTAALRKKQDLQSAGKRVSVNDLILFAAARTLVLHPDLNSQLREDSLLRQPAVNLGFAVGAGDGLYLPVIRQADQLSVEEIAAETERLTAKIEKRQIAEEDMAGGTFTVSNLGMLGVESFTAIIVPGQTGILSLGAATEKPVRGSLGAVEWQPSLVATLTVDHRVVDGLAAAKFLRDLKSKLGSL
jgi:pyruvate dehydrogenase E2 component (dihydrolipoamide acetyltransferase)